MKRKITEQHIEDVTNDSKETDDISNQPSNEVENEENGKKKIKIEEKADIQNSSVPQMDLEIQDGNQQQLANNLVENTFVQNSIVSQLIFPLFDNQNPAHLSNNNNDNNITMQTPNRNETDELNIDNNIEITNDSTQIPSSQIEEEILPAIRSVIDAELVIDRAIEATSAGNHQTGIRLLTLAIDSRTLTKQRESFCYYRRGLIYKNHLREYDYAIKDFDHAIDTDGTLTRIYNSRALLLDEGFGQHDSALKDYTYAITLKPSAIRYFNRAVLLETYFRKFDEALKDYNQALALNPGYARAFNRRGLLYEVDFKRPSDALNDYTQAIRIQPHYADAYFNRGYLYKEHYKDYENAYSDFTQCILNDDTYFEAFLNRAEISTFYNKKYDEALADYSAAIKLDPKNATAYNNRGTLYRDELKDFEKAMTDFDTALSLNPKHGYAHANKAQLLFTLGYPEEAKKHAQKAVDLEHASRGYFIMGLILYHEQKYTEAFAMFDKFVERGHRWGTFYQSALNQIQYLRKLHADKAQLSKELTLSDLIPATNNNGQPTSTPVQQPSEVVTHNAQNQDAVDSKLDV